MVRMNGIAVSITFPDPTTPLNLSCRAYQSTHVTVVIIHDKTTCQVLSILHKGENKLCWLYTMHYAVMFIIQCAKMVTY